MKTGVVWKYVGETPLHALRRFRVRYMLEERIPLTYSGRLDPMADGKVLVLIGDECKKEKEYRTLQKKYIVQIILGVATDTGDILGIASAGPSVTVPPLTILRKKVQSLLGVHDWKYPHFSSKPVGGKPLHEWAREGRIHEIEVPRTRSEIIRLSVHSEETWSASQLQSGILHRLDALKKYNDELACDNLRLKPVVATWKALFEDSTQTYTVLTITCICGSGTYMRTLAEKIGELVGTSACTLSITRTKIGRFRDFFNPFVFWWPQY